MNNVHPHTQNTELVQHCIPLKKCFFLLHCITPQEIIFFVDRLHAGCSSLALQCLIKVSFPIQVEHGL